MYNTTILQFIFAIQYRPRKPWNTAQLVFITFYISMGNKNTLFTVIVIVIVVVGVYQIFDSGGNSGGSAVVDKEKAVEAAFAELLDTLNVNVVRLADNDANGLYLVHPDTGMTFYTTPGECVGECLVRWPPHTAKQAFEDGSIGTTLRSDTGEYQYTWKGEALYTFTDDEFPNSVLGDGFKDVWSIARP